MPNVLVPGPTMQVALDALLGAPRGRGRPRGRSAPDDVVRAARARGLPLVAVPGLPRPLRRAARRGLIVRADGVVAAIGTADLTGLAAALAVPAAGGAEEAAARAS